jgi:hypothetical protein
MAMLNNCQLGLFLSFAETLTWHRCLHRALVIHWPSSFLNRAWDRLWRSYIRQAQLFIICEATCFDLFQMVAIRHSDRSSQQMLCTCWDPNTLTLTRYIKKTGGSVTSEGIICILYNNMLLKYFKYFKTWWIGVFAFFPVSLVAWVYYRPCGFFSVV